MSWSPFKAGHPSVWLIVISQPQQHCCSHFSALWTALVSIPASNRWADSPDLRPHPVDPYPAISTGPLRPKQLSQIRPSHEIRGPRKEDLWHFFFLSSDLFVQYRLVHLFSSIPQCKVLLITVLFQIKSKKQKTKDSLPFQPQKDQWPSNKNRFPFDCFILFPRVLKEIVETANVKFICLEQLFFSFWKQI